MVQNKENIGKKINPLDFESDAKKEECEWDLLCLNEGNGYTQHIYELTEEVCKRYNDLDGLFYDICGDGDVCYCGDCLKKCRK